MKKNLFLELILMRKNKKIKLRHYRSFDECNLPDVCIDKNCEYLELALK